MAVDRNGHITQPKYSELQPTLSRVVSHVITKLSHGFPELIHSLYVYGNVAESRAKMGMSDLDMTIIFNDEPDRAITAHLATVQCELEKNNPIVTKIDFDCGLLQQVLHSDNKLSWGYWLKHHCVYGEDLGLQFHAFKPSKAIAVAVAVAVNGDFLPVLNPALLN
ncbi:hypothetical protein [Providencia heimbachae]|uniref:hypothetical protein n=1 Tax=Providencia heimbachae TaxID=333962 RepID=UPI00093E2C85|nr:hypothetical protein [Providencia heimbachae]